MNTTSPQRERIDWSQLWNPGPVRVFTAEELERAGGDAPSRTLLVMVNLIAALSFLSLLQAAPPPVRLALVAIWSLGLLAVGWVAHRLWRRPERRLLNAASWLLALLGVAVAAVISRGSSGLLDDALHRRWLALSCLALAWLACAGLWFLTVWRSDLIAARLRELEERERAIEMARQLATAQIQPHFLFNTLASVQHWVQTGDPRAAPLLAELTAFLRATLPLFNRQRLRLGDEAEAVRRYLGVMQYRLGQRLRWQVAVDAAAAELQVPPGLLLTLVENAVEHGVQQSLHGGQVELSASVAGGRARICVRDDGPGCTGRAEAPAPSGERGLGLANTRARLEQTFGPEARLQLQSAPGGGCEAVIEWPLALPFPTPRDRPCPPPP